MDEEALAKRQARANKTRKESVATPDIYGTAQGDSEEGSIDGEDEVPAQTGNKRRGSQVFMDEEALAKRQMRSDKEKHRRVSSVAAPPLFHDNYDPEKVTQNRRDYVPALPIHLCYSYPPYLAM